MSTLIVPVAQIDALLPHPNADALEIAHVLGWQTVVKKNQHHVGERVVYFPPDTVLPVEVSDRFGVTPYLSKQRIRCVKLRGEPSFGLVITPDEDWPLGTNVADYYGAVKYEPPINLGAGDSVPEHPLFAHYTEIENLRNYPDALQPGEPVVISEKIHGTNVRVGVIEGQRVAGSHRLQRAEPADERYDRSVYWYPWSLPGVQRMLAELATRHRVVILFGEMFGGGIQSLDYGHKGKLGFRAFDLYLDGKYAHWSDFRQLCAAFGVDVVPELAHKPFSLETIKQLSGGPTTLVEGAQAHIREGVVVHPLVERHDPRLGHVILKYLNDAYLLKSAEGKISDSTDV